MGARYGHLGGMIPPVNQTKREINDCFRKWPEVDRASTAVGLIDAEVTFDVQGRPQRLACSKFADGRTNLRAIFLVLDATRKAAQRGILAELASVAVAFLPAGKVRRPAHEVLGVMPDADVSIAEAAFRVKAKTAHPDHGGTGEMMKELNEALEAFKVEAAKRPR